MSPQKEYGDFQTPLSLARRVATLVRQEETHVRTVVEPTCGIGAFLQATAEHFGKSPNYWGFEVNAEYVIAANSMFSQLGFSKVTIQQRDFYTVDWREFLCSQPGPLLIIGNPPWITNAEMGVIGGSNLPQKSNFQG
jgi:type I restriction-modification system DNA methylase subunit